MADGVRASQIHVEQLISKAVGDPRVTQIYVEQLISKNTGDLRVTQMYVEVLRSQGIDTGWVPRVMII
jgi:predicted DNA-binding transcriptional regulator